MEGRVRLDNIEFFSYLSGEEGLVKHYGVLQLFEGRGGLG